MPRIASLYPSRQSSSNTYTYRCRRVDHNSRLQPPTRARSTPVSTNFRKPRTLAHAQHRPRKPLSSSRHSQAAHRPSITTWKTRFCSRSRLVPEPQPSTLEEKLRIATDRVWHFERQARPSKRLHIHTSSKHRLSTKSNQHRRSHTGASANLTVPLDLRKRNRFKDRLNRIAAGKL